MDNAKRLLLVAAMAAALGCGMGDDDSADDDDDGEDEIGMSDTCAQMFECAELVEPDAIPGWETTFGEDSPCWDNLDAAHLCTNTCADNLLILYQAWPYPWDCDADAPLNTKQIDTIDGVEWEWQVVGVPSSTLFFT